MKNKLIGLVVVLGISGCATDSDPTLISSEPNTMSNMGNSNNISCATHKSQVNQAIQDHDLDRLDNLLATLNRLPDCSNTYLRSMAYIAAAQADRSMQQAQLSEAERWLKRAPIMVWSTQVVHGDIAAYRKQWRDAAHYFNQAIDLINDPQMTPKKPALAKINEVFQSALDAQLLAGEVVAIRPKVRQKTRSIGVYGYPIPVQFEFGGNKMSRKGKESTQKLANYLKKQNVNNIKLIGHTDTKGSHRINDKISKQRSLAVKNYLRELGINGRIDTEGKGKREPLPLPRWNNLTQNEIDQRNRRVEFIKMNSSFYNGSDSFYN